MRATGRNAIVDEWLRQLPKLGTAVDRRPHLAIILDAVLDDNLVAATVAVEEIVRLHAVHESTPSQAVGFLSHLKRLVPAEDAGVATAGVDERIDRLVLVAFDAYVACRERLWEIKWKEGDRRTWLLDRLAAAEEGSRRVAPRVTPLDRRS